MAEAGTISRTQDVDRPLSGIRVLDRGPGAMAGIARYLAEFGAEVIRVAPDGHDRGANPVSLDLAFGDVAANLSKRVATQAEGEALVNGADLLIVARGGVDVAALRISNPSLVILSVSDFGDTGRFASWAGSEAVFHALTGELSRSGIPGRAPLLPPGTLATSCAAAQAAYVALVACWQSLRTGYGDHLDFSVLDGAAQALDPGYGIAGSAAGGVLASKLPRGRPDVRFMYPIFQCADGYVRLCVLAPRQWQGMFKWMGRPEAFGDPSFNTMQVRFASKTLMPAIAALFATKSRCDIEEEGQLFGVPVAAVLRLDEALATEQIVAREAFKPVEIAPGVTVPFPDGVVEVDGQRMGVARRILPSPDDVTWLPRPIVPRPPADGERPFSGLRVLDFGVIVVGAETGRLLGDQGADVIKVETSAFLDGSRQSRSSGPISPTFATGHRNKRSLGVNLRDPKGKELLYALIRETDVVLSNFKGGTLEALGLDYARLRAINPAIIVADSSAFGATGPWSRRMGYGPLVRASAGLTMQWRYPDDPQSFSDAVTVYPDHVAGRIGAMAVIALLIRRLRTSRGGQISISQAEVMLSHMAPQIAADALTRAGHVVSGGAERSSVYAAAGDDEWCVVTVRDDADAAAIERVTAGTDLGAWIADHPPREAMEVLQAAGVPAAAMLRVSELPGFDYYQKRSFFRRAKHPQIAEALIVEAAPVRAERLPDPCDAPAPLLAEHTAELLGERLGLSEEEVCSLVADGALEQFAWETAPGAC